MAQPQNAKIDMELKIASTSILISLAAMIHRQGYGIAAVA